MNHLGTFDLRLILAVSGGAGLGTIREDLARNGWPFGALELQAPFPSDALPPPEQWTDSPAVWTRLQAHARALETALMRRCDRVLVLESDVRFTPALSERWAEILEEAGDRWSMIRLYGGRPKDPLAYAIQGPAIRRAYRALRSLEPRGGVLDRLQRGAARRKRLDVTVAAPRPDDATVPVIAVMGVHRSGSSSLAGALHHLGVHFGDRLGGYEPTGGFEEVGLAALCESALPFPTTDWRRPRPELRAHLEVLVRRLQSEARARGTVVGLKYPHLCALGDVLDDVLGPALRIVRLDRPLDASIRSLVTRSAKAGPPLDATPEQAAAVQRFLHAEREAFLSHYRGPPPVDVALGDLVDDPRPALTRLAEALELSPSPIQMDAAVDHIEPSRVTHGR